MTSNSEPPGQKTPHATPTDASQPAPRGKWRGPRPLRTRLGAQEFHKMGLAGFDPRDPYYFAVSLSWSRFFLLFLAVELAINTVFAVLYSLQPGAIVNQQTPGFVSAFFFSLETLATVGYGEMYPGTVYAHIVSSLEILTGVIFMAIMTGLLFVRFSKPKAKILYADHPVVTTFNGQPTFMLRIGNGRHDMLQDAEVVLYTVIPIISEEGMWHVSMVPVSLLRSRMPAFVLHWTIMHVIDAESPLRTLTNNAAAAREQQFFLSVSARDPAIGQRVSDVHGFTGADIRFGMRYVDAITRDADGRVAADYALLSTIESERVADPTSARPASAARATGA